MVTLLLSVAELVEEFEYFFSSISIILDVEADQGSLQNRYNLL